MLFELVPGLLKPLIYGPSSGDISVFATAMFIDGV